MSELQQSIEAASHLVRQIFPYPLHSAVLLGSGLDNVATTLPTQTEIDYSAIPGMTSPGVVSHAGQIKFKQVGSQWVAFCHGRLHLYEGHSAQQVAFLVYLLRALGAENMIVTNAAGALNAKYQPGEVMMITDHLNLTGQNPIIGQGDELGQRFTDMSHCYNRDLRTQCQVAAAALDIKLHQGIYAGVLGPSLETSAERRMLKTLGGDVVGMSTIMEVIAAKHCEMRILGLSAIANMATGGPDQAEDTIEAVLENVALASKDIDALITAVLKQ